MEKNNINNQSYQENKLSQYPDSDSGIDSVSFSNNSQNKNNPKKDSSENNSNIIRQIEILPENTEKADLTFKVIIIGDSAVGKSSLVNKAVKNQFDFGYTATIGYEFFSFFVKIDEKVLKLQIWDTCGQEIYQSLKELKNSSKPDAKIFLIGNKCDLKDEREVSFEEAQKYADDFEFCKFFESSAKTGINAIEIFEEAANILYDDYIEYHSIISHISSSNSEINDNKKLNDKRSDKSKSRGCC